MACVCSEPRSAGKWRPWQSDLDAVRPGQARVHHYKRVVAVGGHSTARVTLLAAGLYSVRGQWWTSGCPEVQLTPWAPLLTRSAGAAASS